MTAHARPRPAQVTERLVFRREAQELRGAEALSRDLGRVAAVHARYADVAVMTRPSEGAGVELREEIIEGVLFHSGRPALIAPPGWKGTTVGKRVLVAWDASREATRALSEADDLLENAEAVTVLTVDAKPKMFGHGDQPGANIAAHLSRRGLPADVRNVDSMGRSASLAILEEATALDADLVVMGGYAHSRLREAVSCFVAAGRIERGVVKVGEEVEIVGIRPVQKTTVTGIEMFHKQLDEAWAGENITIVALPTRLACGTMPIPCLG